MQAVKIGGLWVAAAVVTYLLGFALGRVIRRG